jgi:phospholipid/cholesterol/gamma-HCH transport system substrate-binding protein
MASLKTKFSVGLFLIIGISLVIIGIVWLGMSNYLEKGRFFVSYFDESVQGLDKDSPVKYRGVSVGRVQRIGVAPDQRLIEVILKIESDVEPYQNTDDVVARLKSVGITGLMFIELERMAPGEPNLSPAISFQPPYPVVPTRPSEMSKFFKGIEDIFNIFKALDTDTISKQLTGALTKINTAIDDVQLETLAADVRRTVQNLQNLLNRDQVHQLLTSADQTAVSMNRMALNADAGITEIRQTISGLDRVIGTGGENFQAVSGDLKASARELRQVMQTASDMLQNSDRQMNTLQRQVLATVTHIDQAGQSLNRILERLENQPSRLIFDGTANEKPSPPE